VIWLWWAPIHAARAARLRPRGSVVVRPADFTFPQLAAWPERATDEALGLHGVEFTDLDEARNRVVIGVSSRSARETAARVLRRHGVPESAVLIEETEPVVLHQSLRDRSRPLEGGFQIVSMVNLSPSICTYGVNAIQHGQPVALTAAHCVDPSRPQVYQPAFGEENLIGHAAAVSGNFSHVAVLRIHPSMQRNFGFIARTTAYATGAGKAGSITVDPFRPRMRITAELPFSTHGEKLDKIGRTTGWTYGSVSDTCVDISIAPGRIVRCQDLIANMHGAAGDSGAPVFRWQGSTVTLGGFYWGQVGTRAVMSRMRNIPLDMGPMSTF
jgi:hypothetical protein